MYEHLADVMVVLDWESMMPENAGWIALAMAGSGALGYLLRFFLKYRDQSIDTLMKIIAAQSESMNIMRSQMVIHEAEIRVLYKENLKCHEDYAGVRAELKILKQQLGD